MEGVKGSPCFLGNPADAPWGANLCDTNVSVCLEKWAGPNAGRTIKSGTKNCQLLNIYNFRDNLI